MSEQKESSVLFSLKELMSLEEDRIQQEEAQRKAEAAAAEQARVDAERRAREEEERRIREEEQARQAAEQRSREEAARLEAIRLAEVEKARVEAEQKARLEAMAAQQQHERALVALKEDKHKKKLRNTLIGGGVAVVLIGSLVGFFVYKNAQENQAALAAQQAEQARLAEEKKKLEAQMAENQKKVEGLLQQLASAKDEATRLALQKQLDEEKAKQDQLRRSHGGGARPASGGGPKPACNCPPGDPLCSCL